MLGIFGVGSQGALYFVRMLLNRSASPGFHAQLCVQGAFSWRDTPNDHRGWYEIRLPAL